ncbi:MAG: UDP-4-amino-4,6-dideoxy-N-acetyl-beta-L-altrosamine transaminase [Prolixibacteraceae bacterium]|nr:UDP-4-amino-4,6-dideoxy-N-acetyl-beta-L-altrosamine transaminase [Prolixibacteraceae bacterium]
MIRKPIPYGHQYISDEDINEVVKTLKSDFITQGPKNLEFETNFAKYVGAKYAVAVCNATAGLHLAVNAMGVKKGTKVIVTPLTFVSSANCVRFCDGDVTFCDIDKDTYLLDINKVREKLESVPKGTYSGLIPVDFAGYPVNMEEYRKLADEYGLWIIEDACHAPGAWFTDSKGKKQKCGNNKYTDATVFSFHPVKHITCGEGGMVTTNDEKIYKSLCLFRTHGIVRDPDLLINKKEGLWYYEMQELGFNYKLTDFQAALGNSQLKRSDRNLEIRNNLVNRYNDAFSNIKGIKIPYQSNDVYHAYHLYTIQVEHRLELYNYMRKNEIHAQVLYYPLNLMPYYRQFGNKKGDLPVVEEYYKHCLSLPMFPTLREEEQNYIIEKVKTFVIGNV